MLFRCCLLVLLSLAFNTVGPKGPGGLTCPRRKKRAMPTHTDARLSGRPSGQGSLASSDPKQASKQASKQAMQTCRETSWSERVLQPCLDGPFHHKPSRTTWGMCATSTRLPRAAYVPVWDDRVTCATRWTTTPPTTHCPKGRGRRHATRQQRQREEQTTVRQCQI